MFDTVHAYNCKAGIELVPIGGETETFDERDKKGMPQIEHIPDHYDTDRGKEMIQQYISAAGRGGKGGGEVGVIARGRLADPGSGVC